MQNAPQPDTSVYTARPPSLYSTVVLLILIIKDIFNGDALGILNIEIQ